jgi:tetratricopeptide (TPR) repeat protein
VQVAVRHVGRALAWSLGCLVVPVVLGAGFGPRWVAVGIGLDLLTTLWLLLWLPRTAHAQFAAARFSRAARRYRVIGASAFSAGRERAALLSRAGCALAGGHHAAAERLLAQLDGATLAAAERVTWLNNRACLALEAGHDPVAALALADDALALRPDVPAVLHTRASALIALGRLDEAISMLEAMRAGGELAPALEAVRCRELALAWEHKGQPDYAADYRDRARLVAR